MVKRLDAAGKPVRQCPVGAHLAVFALILRRRSDPAGPQGPAARAVAVAALPYLVLLVLVLASRLVPPLQDLEGEDRPGRVVRSKPPQGGRHPSDPQALPHQPRQRAAIMSALLGSPQLGLL